MTPTSAAPPSARSDPQAYLIDWFRSLSRPLLLVRIPDLHILAFNDAGAGLLKEGPDLRRQQGRLAFCDPATTERFHTHLALSPDEIRPWPLKQRERERYLILEIDRLPTPEDARAVMIAVHFSEGDPGHHWSDIGPIFGLTKAEERIAKRMTGGENVEEIAAELYITVETARTHIRRIYGKVGVGSREQLSAVLLPFRVG